MAEFRIARERLDRALRAVQGVLTAKANMPALACVLIDAREGGIVIRATDLEVSHEVEVGADVVQPGALVIDGKRLLAVVASMSGEEVSVTSDADERITLRGGRSEFVLAGMTPDVYPRLPEVPESECVTVDGAVVRTLVERTLYAVSVDESRPNLCGAQFDTPEDGELRVVSTDGHRLVVAQSAAGGTVANQWPPVIVPRKGLVEMQRALSGAVRPVAMSVAAGTLTLRWPGGALYARLVDGTFPDVRQVIPRAPPMRVTIERTDLLDALKRASILASERTHGVRLTFGEAVVVVTTNHPDLGNAREEVRAEVSQDAEGQVMALNARYLSQAVAAVAAPSVELCISGPLAPIMLREPGVSGYLAVIMPMRL